MLIEPNYEPGATGGGLDGEKVQEECVCLKHARKRGVWESWSSRRESRGCWDVEGGLTKKWSKGNKESRKKKNSRMDSTSFDTGDSHFPWTHLWVNGHLCFTFCTDLAHSCVPGAGYNRWAGAFLPARQQTEPKGGEETAERRKQESCSKSSVQETGGPIRDVSDSTGVRGEACFISKWDTSGNGHTHI